MNTISTLWTKLDPMVQQWLLSNPGTVVLPRTLVNRVEVTTGERLSSNEHGEHWFSSEELVFLRARTRAEALIDTLSTTARSPIHKSPAQGGFPVEALDR